MEERYWVKWICFVPWPWSIFWPNWRGVVLWLEHTPKSALSLATPPPPPTDSCSANSTASRSHYSLRRAVQAHSERPLQEALIAQPGLVQKEREEGSAQWRIYQQPMWQSSTPSERQNRAAWIGSLFFWTRNVPRWVSNSSGQKAGAANKPFTCWLGQLLNFSGTCFVHFKKLRGKYIFRKQSQNSFHTWNNGNLCIWSMKLLLSQNATETGKLNNKNA